MILACGFILRASGINYGLPSQNLALTTSHPDEATALRPLEKWRPKELYFHPDQTLHWGGFHLFPTAALLKVAQFAGYLKVGTREFYLKNLQEADKIYKIARSLTVLCAMVSILALFFIVRSLWGYTGGILAVIFYSFSAVHIVNSFIVRPDSMMVMFVLLSVFFSLKVWDIYSSRFSLISGIFFGLAVATKYNAAPSIIFPVLLHLLSPDRKNRRNLFIFSLAAAVAFLIGCPYSILDFKGFYSGIQHLLSQAKGGIVPIPLGSTFGLYWTYFLPYGMGWPHMIAAILGWIWMLSKILKREPVFPVSDLSKNRLGGIWIFSVSIIYIVIASPKAQQTWYTLPLVPLFAFFASYFFSLLIQFHKKWIRVFSFLLTCFFIAYMTIYSLAYTKLFWEKNVREIASEWIEQNIPKGESIGIARSYFWTPGILRQSEPPYQLLKGGDDQSFIDDAVLGLEKVSQKANYLVLTEYEYRVYLTKRFGNYPEQERVLRKIMEKDFREIACFQKEAEFLWFRFPKKEDDPYDWSMPNPTIKIFKKVKA